MVYVRRPLVLDYTIAAMMPQMKLKIWLKTCPTFSLQLLLSARSHLLPGIMTMSQQQIAGSAACPLPPGDGQWAKLSMC